MTGAESLALLLASGVQAEAVVRSAAESLDKDWAALSVVAQDMTDLPAARDALLKMETLAPYRVLLGACVASWDGPDETSTPVVRIGGQS